MKKNLKEKIVRIMDAPREILLGEPKITMFGDNELLIENYKSVLEYNDEFLRIKLKGKDICITGKAFELGEMTDESVRLTGEIAGVEFL